MCDNEVVAENYRKMPLRSKWLLLCQWNEQKSLKQEIAPGKFLQMLETESVNASPFSCFPKLNYNRQWNNL